MIKDRIKAVKISELKVKENIWKFQADYTITYNDELPIEYFHNIMSIVHERDAIKIFITKEDDDGITLSRDTENIVYNNFKDNCEYSEVVKVYIEVLKHVCHDMVSIYDMTEFVLYLNSIQTEEVMYEFSKLYKKTTGYINFIIPSDDYTFSTRTLSFVSSQPEAHDKVFNRNMRLEDCKNSTYFESVERYSLLPDDFYIDNNCSQNPLSNLFGRICTVLSLCYVSSNVKISGKSMEGFVSGLKNYNFNYKLSDIKNNPNLYKIYSWIYSGGNLVDKVVIARNIICLHCQQRALYELDSTTVAVMESNLRLYSIDNVMQYLELKNKIGQFICDEVAKTGEYAHSILDKFKVNIIAIFGFLFTAIIGDLIDIKQEKIIFTPEITLLTEVILVGSVVYLFVCIWQTKYELKKVYDSYDALKSNYNEVLSPDDISQLFHNNKIITDMKRTINVNMKTYIAIWILFLLLIACTVEALGGLPLVRGICSVVREIL